VDALHFDSSRYNDALEAGDASVADAYLVDNSQLEYLLLRRGDSYSLRQPFDPKLLQDTTTILREQARHIDNATAQNASVIANSDDEALTDVLAQLATTRDPSNLYPTWNPTRLQLMQRKAMQGSWLEMYEQFMGQHDDLRLEQRQAPPETVIRTAINLGSAACAAIQVIEAGLQTDANQGVKDYLKSHAGMTHEFDVMLFMLLNGGNLTISDRDDATVKLATTTDWLKPSSFLDDVHNHKLDGLAYTHIHQPNATGRHIGVIGLDAKLSAGEGRPHLINHPSGIPTLRINRKAIGLDNPNTPSGSFAKSMLTVIEQEQQPDENPAAARTRRLARGLALSGVTLGQKPYLGGSSHE
jgi:hypothetical protein